VFVVCVVERWWVSDVLVECVCSVTCKRSHWCSAWFLRLPFEGTGRHGAEGAALRGNGKSTWWVWSVVSMECGEYGV
jgi:hypothetical protein